MADLRLKKTILEVEDNHHMKTEWDIWDEVVQDGYEKFDENKREEGLQLWDKAWEMFQSIMKHMSEKVSVYQLMDGFRIMKWNLVMQGKVKRELHIATRY